MSARNLIVLLLVSVIFVGVLGASRLANVKVALYKGNMICIHMGNPGANAMFYIDFSQNETWIFDTKEFGSSSASFAYNEEVLFFSNRFYAQLPVRVGTPPDYREKVHPNAPQKLAGVLGFGPSSAMWLFCCAAIVSPNQLEILRDCSPNNPTTSYLRRNTIRFDVRDTFMYVLEFENRMCWDKPSWTEFIEIDPPPPALGTENQALPYHIHLELDVSSKSSRIPDLLYEEILLGREDDFTLVLVAVSTLGAPANTTQTTAHAPFQQQQQQQQQQQEQQQQQQQIGQHYGEPRSDNAECAPFRLFHSDFFPSLFEPLTFLRSSFERHPVEEQHHRNDGVLLVGMDLLRFKTVLVEYPNDAGGKLVTSIVHDDLFDRYMHVKLDVGVLLSLWLFFFACFFVCQLAETAVRWPGDMLQLQMFVANRLFLIWGFVAIRLYYFWGLASVQIKFSSRLDLHYIFSVTLFLELFVQFIHSVQSIAACRAAIGMYLATRAIKDPARFALERDPDIRRALTVVHEVCFVVLLVWASFVAVLCWNIYYLFVEFVLAWFLLSFSCVGLLMCLFHCRELSAALILCQLLYQINAHIVLYMSSLLLMDNVDIEGFYQTVYLLLINVCFPVVAGLTLYQLFFKWFTLGPWLSVPVAPQVPLPIGNSVMGISAPS